MVWPLTDTGVPACCGSPCSRSWVKDKVFGSGLQAGYRYRAAMAEHTNVSRSVIVRWIYRY